MDNVITAPPAATRTTADYIALEDAYGASNYKPLDVVLTRGAGVYVWDVEGRRYERRAVRQGFKRHPACSSWCFIHAHN